MACLEFKHRFAGLHGLLAEWLGVILHAAYSSPYSRTLFLCDQAGLNSNSVESQVFQGIARHFLLSQNSRSYAFRRPKNERLQLEENELCFHKNLREKLKRSYTGGTLECGRAYGSVYPENKEVSPD